jgi:hypothetical protein
VEKMNRNLRHKFRLSLELKAEVNLYPADVEGK